MLAAPERFRYTALRPAIECDTSDQSDKSPTPSTRKSNTGQINEALCKVLCHNVCVLIQEMHELGIEPAF